MEAGLFVSQVLPGDGSTGVVSRSLNAELSELAERLASPTPNHMISYRSGPAGRSVPYLTGDAVTAIANDVFGPAGWVTTVMSVECEEREATIGSAGAVCSKLLEATAVVSVGLVVLNVTRQDVGVSTEVLKPGVTAAQYAQFVANLKKSAVTDARKRCFRQCGTIFGGNPVAQPRMVTTPVRRRTAVANGGEPLTPTRGVRGSASTVVSTEDGGGDTDYGSDSYEMEM